MLQIQSPFQQFFGLSGDPLDDGSIYIGAAGQNPEINPIVVYWDDAATIPAAQPIKTLNGYIVRNGTPARVYTTAADFSLTTKDRKGRVVFNVLDATSLSNLQIQLASSTGASLVGFIQAESDAQPRTMLDKGRECFTFDDFIPAGTVTDSVDCSVWIQKAITGAFAAGKSIKNQSGRVYGMSATVTIPQQPDFDRWIDIDCGNSTFKMLANVTLFQSASWGTETGTTNSFGISLCNFTISTSLGTLALGASSLKIQDWHQGCSIKNIKSFYAQTLLESANNFYCDFEKIETLLLASGSLQDRYIFTGEHNLNRFVGLVSQNCRTGYRFDGTLSAVTFDSCSGESLTNVAVFNGNVSDITISGGYFELFTNVAFSFNARALGVKFTNNYINFLAAGSVPGSTNVFLDYVPGLYNNITIAKDNVMVNYAGENQIIFTNDTTYAQGITYELYNDTAATLAPLLVDNASWPTHMAWDQKKHMPGMLANVVNVHAVGNYSGKFTDGYANSHGFSWTDTGANTLRMATRIVRNTAGALPPTNLIYVNLLVVWTGAPGFNYVKGVFVGDDFYEFDGTALTKTTSLTASTVSGYLQIDGGFFFGGVVTGCTGEVRLV